MRRKRKVRYYVQDWYNRENRDAFWWGGGEWTTNPKPPFTNIKTCRTFDQALKVARRMFLKGGGPLISQRVSGKKARWTEYRYNPNKE